MTQATKSTNPTGIGAVTFAALWQHQKNRPYLAVLAFAYATCSVGFLLQYFVLPIGFEDLARWVIERQSAQPHSW